MVEHDARCAPGCGDGGGGGREGTFFEAQLAAEAAVEAFGGEVVGVCVVESAEFFVEDGLRDRGCCCCYGGGGCIAGIGDLVAACVAGGARAGFAGGWFGEDFAGATEAKGLLSFLTYEEVTELGAPSFCCFE